MSYIVNKTDGNIAAVVDDGTLNTTTSLNLLGRGYNDYGDVIAQNLVGLLENFASDLAPLTPLPGQVWYHKAEKKLRVYDGNKFTVVNNVSVTNSNRPSSPAPGDFCFDADQQQLFYYTSTNWQLIAPAYSSSQSRTELVVEDFTDTNGLVHPVLVLFAAGKRTVVISSVPDFETYPDVFGFKLVRTGLNIVSEYLIANAVINGTSTYSEMSAGLDIEADATYMHANANTGTVGTLYVANDGGITIGAIGDIKISTLVASPYAFGSSISAETDKSLALVGYGGGTIVLDNATNWIGINKSNPEYDLDVAGAINADEYIVSNQGYYFGDLSEIVSTSNTITISPGGNTSLVLESSGDITVSGNTTLDNTLTVNNGNIFVDGGQVSIQQYHTTMDGQELGAGWPTDSAHAVTKQYADNLTLQNLMPIGSIIMWYGTAITVPEGWHICDGTMGTPDLRGQFVMGAGSVAMPNTTGGASSITTTTELAGDHTHTGTTIAGGVHDHGGTVQGHALTTDELPSHTHDVDELFGQIDDRAGGSAVDRNGDSFQPYNQWGNDYDGDTGAPVYFLNRTAGAGGNLPHVHGIDNSSTHTHDFTTSQIASHQHSITFDNRPNWTALYYIMRINNTLISAIPPIY